MRSGLDIARIQAILFDIDGTIADTDDAVIDRLSHRLRFLHRIIPAADVQTYSRRLVMAAETPGNALIASLDRLGIDELLGPLVNAVHRLRGERSDPLPVISGVHDALQTLEPHYPLAIVTAREQSSSYAFLETFDLLPLFKTVVTARTCRRSKPHPAPLLWAASSLGVSPQSCLMVGDTTVDIRAGIRAGAQTVGVLCGFGQFEELRKAGAALVLDSTADLPQVLLTKAP